MLEKKYDFFFFIPDKKEMYNVIHKIYEGSTNQKTLNNNLIFGNGLYVWNQHKNDLTNDFCENSAPIVYCSSIDKNEFVYKELPDKNTEKKLYSFTSKEVEKFLLQGKRLLIQRTSTLSNTQRIKACIIEDLFLEKYPKYFLENHVYFLYNKLDKNANINLDDLYFYEAILNSKVLNYIFRYKNGNTQVSATELNLLPIKVNYKTDIIQKQREYKTNMNSKIGKEVEELIFYNYELSNYEIDLISGSGE